MPIIICNSRTINFRFLFSRASVSDSIFHVCVRNLHATRSFNRESGGVFFIFEIVELSTRLYRVGYISRWRKKGGGCARHP